MLQGCPRFLRYVCADYGPLPALLCLRLQPSTLFCLLLCQDYPEFRQAQSLKTEVDERVVKDGLLGLGVAGAVAAVALGLIFGAGRKR